MQHVLTVNVLMALAFITSLTTQTGTHDMASLARSETANVQGVDTQSKEQNAERRRQDLEAKRAEIEEKNAAKRTAITEKLSGKRAEQCVAKQEQINQMLDERSEAARRHYENFAAIHGRLEAYAAERELDIEYSNALNIIVPAAQDDALLAVEELERTDFDCLAADASAPGALIKEQIAAAKQELTEYRDAIKDYAEAVRAAAATPTETPNREASTDSDQEANNE